MPEYIFELEDALYNEETGEAVFKPKIVSKLVRCKDCKHRPMLENPIGKQYGFNVIAPEDEHGWEDNTCPYLVDDGFYSRYPSDDDFCSCGERRK